MNFGKFLMYLHRVAFAVHADTYYEGEKPSMGGIRGDNDEYRIF